jgi:hypothetical protein
MEVNLNWNKIKYKHDGIILSDFIIKFWETKDKTLISFDENIIGDIIFWYYGKRKINKSEKFIKLRKNDWVITR